MSFSSSKKGDRMKLWMAYLTLIVGLVLVGCQPAGTCNNSISGNSNVASCGGSGDDQDVTTTTPAPIIVPPVVITPIAPPVPEGA